MAGETDDAHVVAEVLAAKLCPNADFSGELKNFLFPFKIAEAVPAFGSFGRQ